jgi:hypothetical protein
MGGEFDFGGHMRSIFGYSSAVVRPPQLAASLA